MAMPSPFQRPTISYCGRRWVGDGKEMGKSWYGDGVNYQPVAKEAKISIFSACRNGIFSLYLQ